MWKYEIFLQVPPIPPDVMEKLQQKSQIIESHSSQPVKGILKKPKNLGSEETIKINGILKKSKNEKKKRNGHVNYAFDFKEERPKTVTVIDKRTGKSKPLELNKNKSYNHHTISAEVH